ncbi:MAG: Npun_F0494 family protein [Cyanobacteria bacterium P01_A01_bin.114]
MEISGPSELGAMQYSSEVLRRAERALRASPFYMKLLDDMRSQSVSLNAIKDDRGSYNGYTRQPISEVSADNQLTWLISVGVLRREVDGQGLTDSFRLTPLGRQLLAVWKAQGHPDWQASLLDYLHDAKNRWLRLPNWLR